MEKLTIMKGNLDSNYFSKLYSLFLSQKHIPAHNLLNILKNCIVKKFYPNINKIIINFV